jgi:hypothetical protein
MMKSLSDFGVLQLCMQYSEESFMRVKDEAVPKLQLWNSNL